MPPDDLIRYLHAAYAAPNDGVTDDELLRRCGSARDDAAFELLMRRHADLVWRVCQAVACDHHSAEDAFQATFLALARRAGSIGSATVAGWLCRVAYHAALKARPRPVAELIHEMASLPDDRRERADLAQVLHEELNRLADNYRVPLVLCYLQDFTQAEAARHLGWPVGTVATRVTRGRDRLRARLIRRGIVLPSSGLVAAFSAGPAHALPATSIATTARAIAAGTGLSDPIHHLAQGALSAMTKTRIWPVTAALALVAGALFTFAGSADPPGQPASVPEDKEKGKEQQPMERSITITPAIQALVTASTDVIVADVVETNPRRAMEGARDTVKLKVVRTLLGRPTVGETIGVYYHLTWSDEKMENLESTKFIKGKRYVVFLGSHLTRGPEGEGVAYELTDRWLSVLPDHVDLVREVTAAVRGPHGDARGEWSSTDGSIAGLQGRLVAYRSAAGVGDTPIITVYLDLLNTAGSNNTTEFVLDGAKVVWTVSDASGKAIAPTSPPGNWQPAPTRKLTLAAREGGRLPLTVGGAGIMRGGVGHLEFGLGEVWEFPRGGAGPYDLTGKITIAPTGQPGRWFGTLDLPKLRIPLGE